MALVPAICTQCGAKIEVDDTHEAGVCKYCGTAFVTEKAINQYTTYITTNNNFAGANINIVGGNIDNLVKMAENAIEAGNGKEAVEYANRALEINPESSKAWLLKMKAIEYIGTVGNPQVSEAISYGDNAIKYAEDKENITAEVYNYYINRATSLMLIAISKLRDVAKIKQLVGLGVSAMQGVANGDVSTRDLYLNLSLQALMLKLKIDETYISDHESMQESIVNLSKLYINLCEADVERLAIYGSKLMPEAIEARQKTLQIFKKGLPDEKANSINSEGIKKNNDNGCYIATCVYGSYDCPEVWTLRRFRDYTLDATWYGRLFIKCYYAVSPTIVEWFGENKWFKIFWKIHLDKMVSNLNNRGIENTSYTDKY